MTKIYRRLPAVAVALVAAGVAAFSPSPTLRLHRSSNGLHARLAATDDANGSGEPNDASRRDALASVLSGTAVFGLSAGGALLGAPAPAFAGVGAVPPFDVARKEYFPGALKNSVVSLRITSSLRWINTSETRRRANVAYINPKRTVLGLLRCPDDPTPFEDSLAAVVGKEYAGSLAVGGGPGGIPVDLKADLAALVATIPDDVRAKVGGVNVVLVYGPHVGLSKEGRLGYVEVDRDEPLAISEYAKDNDDPKSIIAATKQAYKTTRDKVEGLIAAAGGGIWDSGIAELTILGGITINRAKFGKDKGEDYFYPLSAKSYKADGSTTDRFDGAFGDLDIPPKDREWEK